MMEQINKNKAGRSRPPYLDVAVWGAIFLIFCGVFGGTFSLVLTLLRGLINTLLLAALFYLNGRLLSSWARPLVQWKYWTAVGVALAAFTFIRANFNDYIAVGSQLDLPRVAGTHAWLWGSAFSNFGILALSYLFFLNDRWRETDRLRLVQTSERHKAELLQLRSHINPHFLFNVLNNVYALASTGSDRTAPTVLQLSHLLRCHLPEPTRPGGARGGVCAAAAVRGAFPAARSAALRRRPRSQGPHPDPGRKPAGSSRGVVAR
jgi:hypothetical protein